jgi:hypothetical protein
MKFSTNPIINVDKLLSISPKSEPITSNNKDDLVMGTALSAAHNIMSVGSTLQKGISKSFLGAPLLRALGVPEKYIMTPEKAQADYDQEDKIQQDYAEKHPISSTIGKVIGSGLMAAATAPLGGGATTVGSTAGLLGGLSNSVGNSPDSLFDPYKAAVAGTTGLVLGGAANALATKAAAPTIPYASNEMGVNTLGQTATNPNTYNMVSSEAPNLASNALKFTPKGILTPIANRAKDGVIDNIFSSIQNTLQDPNNTDLSSLPKTLSDRVMNTMTTLTGLQDLFGAMHSTVPDQSLASFAIKKLFRYFSPVEYLKTLNNMFDGSISTSAMNMLTNPKLQNTVATTLSLLSKQGIPDEIKKYMLTKTANSLNRAGLTVSPSLSDSDTPKLHLDIFNKNSNQNAANKQQRFALKPVIDVNKLLQK